MLKNHINKAHADHGLCKSCLILHSEFSNCDRCDYGHLCPQVVKKHIKSGKININKDLYYSIIIFLIIIFQFMNRFIVKNVAQLWTRHTCKNITGLFMKAKETTNANTAEKNTLIKKASVVISNENMIMSEMNNAISVENYFSPKKF